MDKAIATAQPKKRKKSSTQWVQMAIVKLILWWLHLLLTLPTMAM